MKANENRGKSEGWSVSHAMGKSVGSSVTMTGADGVASTRSVGRTASQGTATPTSQRPRGEVLTELMIQLSAVEATIGELGSPRDEEEIVDFLNLIRCRLRPLRGDDPKCSSKKRAFAPESLTDEPEQPPANEVRLDDVEDDEEGIDGESDER